VDHICLADGVGPVACRYELDVERLGLIKLRIFLDQLSDFDLIE
jgi:hypothetical protein